MAFGLVALTWWVVYPHPHIDSATKGEAVHLIAGLGLGYEYRWDFQSDGEFDTEWSKDDRDVTYAFDTDAPLRGVEVRLIEVSGRNRGAYVQRLSEGDLVELSTRHLGEGWQVKGDTTAVPTAQFIDGKLYIRPGAASLSLAGVTQTATEVEVLPGATFQLGPFAKLRVDAVVESTLAVRNVFGNVAQTRETIVIQPKAERATASRATSSDTVGRPAAAFAQREKAR
jgi:hypothetical protein